LTAARGDEGETWTSRANPNVRTEVVAQLVGLPATRIPMSPRTVGYYPDEAAAIQQLGTTLVVNRRES
jgi:hypothetical protein